MNGTADDLTGNTTEPPADAEVRLADALSLLFDHDDQWRIRTAIPGHMIVTRGWPDGTVDTLIILSPDRAYGSREDPRQQRVWAMNGPVEQIAAGVRDLPVPGASDAPSEPIPERRRDDLL